MDQEEPIDVRVHLEDLFYPLESVTLCGLPLTGREIDADINFISCPECFALHEQQMEDQLDQEEDDEAQDRNNPSV